MLPLPIPVLSISESEEEDEGYPCIFFLNDNPTDVKQTCDEEVDVGVIDSRDVNQMDVDVDQASSTSRKKGSSGDNMKNVDDSSMGKGKEDWDMYADHSSFWDDRQRLTDSWYGYEKVPNDGLDDIFIEGASNIENNNYVHEAEIVPNDDEIPNDSVDNLLLQELVNIEAEESILQSLRTVSVNSANVGSGRNNNNNIDCDNDDNVGGGGGFSDDDCYVPALAPQVTILLYQAEG